MSGFSQRITEVATWTLLADLMRRHEAAHALRIIETHPGGGQYDCRALFTASKGEVRSLVDFNLASGNAHIWNSVGKPRPRPALSWASAEGDRVAYVPAAVESDDRREVRHWFEAVLGLPVVAYAPPWSRHSLTYGIIAGIAARHAFLGAQVRGENGAIDTSGEPPEDTVRPEVRAVPAYAERLRHMDGLATPLHHPAYEAWLLMVAGRKQPAKAVALLGIDACLYVLDKPDKVVDLYAQWQKAGQKLAPVVERLDGLVVG